MLRPMNTPAVSVASARTRLALSAFVLLFVELALIRWLGANIIYLAYFSNFVLVGSFLGIGLGFLWASRSERSLFPWAAVALSAFVAMVRLFDINIEVGGSNLIFFADQRPVGPPRWIMLPIVFAAVALCVAAIADGVARNFRRLAPLDAYRWDLVGSILGVVGFSALAFLGSPPVVWGAIVGSLLLGLAWNHGVSARRWGAASLLLLLAVLGVESFGGSQAWSPYYALSWDEHDEGGIVMRINDVATWDQHPKHEAAMYDFVYDFRTAEEVGDVLIIGAGSGNDVSVALGHGAERVDAVEIDPVILDLARTHHPGQPYADDRVNVHIDDGRAFLERTDRQWDLILLALPDSLTVVLGQGSIRLESYLFTQEAIAAYRDHLAPGGVFGMYNFMREGWLVDRYAATLADAFGEAPCVVDPQANLLTVLAVSDDPGALRCHEDDRWLASADGPAPVSDDRPFPYLRTPHVPRFYLMAIALVLGASVLAVRAAAGPMRGLWRQADVFFMGLAFLLLETKNVVGFALLFGTTWFVNALVFVSVLVSVLAAVEVSRRVRVRRPEWLYAVLAAALALNWIVPTEWLLTLAPGARLVVAGGVAFLPIFAANLIFADRFRDEDESTVAFGANVLGAVVGGLLEYSALLTGYRSLLVIVAVAYALALLTGRRYLRPA